MVNIIVDETREKIVNLILEKDRPFKLSDLFKDLQKAGIKAERKVVLDILEHLYESNLIDRAEVEEDVWGFESLNNR